MIVLHRYTVSYVTPESPEEEAELKRLIAAVKLEKVGRDFDADDLEFLPPSRDNLPPGFFKKD